MPTSSADLLIKACHPCAKGPTDMAASHLGAADLDPFQGPELQRGAAHVGQGAAALQGAIQARKQGACLEAPGAVRAHCMALLLVSGVGGPEGIHDLGGQAQALQGLWGLHLQQLRPYGTAHAHMMHAPLLDSSDLWAEQQQCREPGKLHGLPDKGCIWLAEVHT